MTVVEFKHESWRRDSVRQGETRGLVELKSQFALIKSREGCVRSKVALNNGEGMLS